MFELIEAFVGLLLAVIALTIGVCIIIVAAVAIMTMMLIVLIAVALIMVVVALALQLTWHALLRKVGLRPKASKFLGLMEVSQWTVVRTLRPVLTVAPRLGKVRSPIRARLGLDEQ